MSVVEELSRFRAEDAFGFLEGHCCGAEQWRVTLNIPCLHYCCLPKHNQTSLPYPELDLAPTTPPSPPLQALAPWGVSQWAVPDKKWKLWAFGVQDLEGWKGDSVGNSFYPVENVVISMEIFCCDKRQPFTKLKEKSAWFPTKISLRAKKCFRVKCLLQVDKADPPVQLLHLL